MNNSFYIGKKKIGFSHPTYFIADIAANHDGNLDKGHFANSWKKKSSLEADSSSLRVITITIFLCLITYWIFKF